MRYVSVPLGSFIPWDYEANTKRIVEELGWQTDEMESLPVELNPQGEKIECFMQGTRDYIKYIKRGYSRVAQVNAQNVRKGRLEPELVAASNDEHDGVKPASLEVFLEYMGLTEEEFNTIVTSMSVSPYEHDFSAMKDGGALWDMDLWAREDNR